MHFSKTGKMSSLALENSQLSVKKPSDSGVVYCGVSTLCQPMPYGDSISDRPMDASSKLTNIVDQSAPHHDWYKVHIYVYSKQPIFGLTQEWFRELSFSRLEC